MKKSYLANGNGIVINIITDGNNGFVETCLKSGQFGYIRTTAKVTDVEIQEMIKEMKQIGFNYYTEE